MQTAMRSSLRTLGLVLLLIAPQQAIGQGSNDQGTPSLPAAVLSKPYTPTLGDMVALTTSELMTALKSDADAPTIAVYDRDAKKIAVIVYGSKRTIDGAKQGLDVVREAMKTRLPLINEMYQVELSPADFGYVYYNNEKEIVRWEEGKYMIAGE